MAKQTVMLRRNWPGTFNRSIRDKNGKIKKTISFEPGVPVDLTEAELKAVSGDIGNSLQLVEIDKAGGARVVVSDKEREEATRLAAEKDKAIESFQQQIAGLEKDLAVAAELASKQQEEIASQLEVIAEWEALADEEDGDDDPKSDAAD